MTGLQPEDFDALDDILDDLRTRYEETPQWEFCEGFMVALICCRRAMPEAEWLPVLLGLEDDEGGAGFSDEAQKVKFYDLTMDAGTILYVPAYWWHQVISYSTIVSVNIWCKTSIFKAEWGALQLIPLYIRNLMGFNIFPKRF
jgi:hypothetical protein